MSYTMYHEVSSCAQEQLANQYTGQYAFESVDLASDDQLNRLNTQVKMLTEEIDRLVQERMQLSSKIIEYERMHQLLLKQPQITPDNLVQVKSDLEKMRLSFFNLATSNREQSLLCLQNINKTLEDLRQVQTCLICNKLATWKRDQQLANNGCTPSSADNSLERIHKLTLCLADVLSQVRRMLYKFQAEHCILVSILNEEQSLTFLKESILKSIALVEEQIRNLVRSTFVIEKQPPQVMKTNTKFVATVAMLTGSKFNSEAMLPTVNAYLINGLEASEFLKNPKPVNLEPSRKRPAKGDAGANEILNNSVPLEINPSNGQVVGNFRNMQLKRIRRTEKKGVESVMEEKFAILFTAVIKVFNGLPELFIWTMSLPVVVIVHGNQEPHAWATITWDNAFAEPARKLFTVVDPVPWPDLAQVLVSKFEMYTKIQLTQQDLHFLGNKVLRKELCYEALQQERVPWNLFARENLSDVSGSFTFWEWFFAILKVSREHLKHFSSERMLVSFLTRQQAKDMLLHSDQLLETGLLPGTFLLRFSDSELGGVTIAWLSKNRDGHKEVVNLQPFTSRDLAIRGLADRISDLKQLTNFYPNIPKDQIFGKFYTANPLKRANGYLTPILALTLPECTNTCPIDTSTSGHFMPNIQYNSPPIVADVPAPPSDLMTNSMSYISESSPESSSVSSIVPDQIEYIDYSGAVNGVWNQIAQQPEMDNCYPYTN